MKVARLDVLTVHKSYMVWCKLTNAGLMPMPSDAKSIIPPTPSDAEHKGGAPRALIPDVADPADLLTRWLAEAREREPNDSNAMSLATVDADGMPDVRVVLLKDITAEGLTFYTNLGSAKAAQINTGGKAAVGFHWKSLRRQVRVRGNVHPVGDAEANAYFAQRSRGSQIGAWASDQSRPLDSRKTLEDKALMLEDKYKDDDSVPRPPQWGGFRLVPLSIEFWQDQPFRLHDRLKFSREGDLWTTERLYP